MRRPQGGGPGLVTWDAIHTDAQHLGILPVEVGDTRLQRRDLRRSAGSPVKAVEGQHHLPLPPEVAEANGLPSGRRKGEIRRTAPDHELPFRCRHLSPAGEGRSQFMVHSSW